MPRLRRLLGSSPRCSSCCPSSASSPRTSCSCRASAARPGFPYYMNTYGLHSIHGRAPAVATGVALARPDLDVWVIGGDGDMLSIGGNHLIHALRRNVNLKILMFNNQIYGLTKGQYSPTSEMGKVTKSTPFGSLDHPFNPISVALGAEATFVARTHDMDRKHMMEMFRARARAPGRVVRRDLPELQRLQRRRVRRRSSSKDARPDMLIELQHGEPIRFGADREQGVDAQRVRRGDDRRRRRRRRGPAPRARRAPRATRRSRSRSRGSPTQPHDAHAGRGVPRRRAPGLRASRCSASWSTASERSGPGDLAAAARLRRRPGPVGN